MRSYYTCTFKYDNYVNYILSTEDDVSPITLERHRLKEGDPTLRNHGDNEVYHWKMEATYNPEVMSTVPDTKLACEDQVDTSRSNFKEYWFVKAYGGINSYYYENGYIRTYPYGGGRDYTSTTSVEYQFYYENKRWMYHARQRVGVVYSSDPTARPEWGRWKTGSGVPGSFGGNLEVINFHVPVLPYYWIDHMNGRIRSTQTVSDMEALSECIRNTIQEYTTYDTNGYANILQFLDMLKDARDASVGDLIKDCKSLYDDALRAIGKSMKDFDNYEDAMRAGRKALRQRSKGKLGSAWLKYRYAYNTTKADYEQFVRAKVGEYLGKTDGRVLRGSIGITGGTLKVKMRLRDNTRVNFDKFLISANQYGMFPGLYNVWDMIPFSFVADWVAPVGDELQDIDQSIFFRYYEVEELLVSRKVEATFEESWGTTKYKYYERRLLSSMPQWEIYEDPKKTSGKTIFKRCLDGISIVSGFV